MNTPSLACPCYGCDVGKSTIVVAPHADSASPKRLVNQPRAINAWLDQLPANAHLGMEATGRYHELLANCAVRRGFRVFVINPKQLSHYAKGIGQRGKTDPLDARMIARYIEREGPHLRPYAEPSETQRILRNLLTQRANVVRHRQAIRLSAQDADLASWGTRTIKCAMSLALRSLDRLIQQIDRQLRQQIQADTQLAVKWAVLRTITGIGPLNAAALIQRLDRTPFHSSDALVAAYGLDPRPKDSGHMAGRRQLTKQGNAEDRRLIYLAAQSAAKTATFQPLYRALLAKGFATTQAIVIIARKLLRVALAVWNSGMPFDPSKIHALQSSVSDRGT